MNQAIFYVIEYNEGNGSTGKYIRNILSKTDETGEFVCHGDDTKEITGNIYEALKFFDKESAEFIFIMLNITMKSWLVTEHIFQD